MARVGFSNGVRIGIGARGRVLPMQRAGGQLRPVRFRVR